MDALSKLFTILLVVFLVFTMSYVFVSAAESHGEADQKKKQFVVENHEKIEEVQVYNNNELNTLIVKLDSLKKELQKSNDADLVYRIEELEWLIASLQGNLNNDLDELKDDIRDDVEDLDDNLKGFADRLLLLEASVFY